MSLRFLSKNKYSKIYRAIILYFIVLYGCENSSFTLREECKLRVFENRVLRRIFWPKSDEVRGEWEKLHYEELNDLYSSCNTFWAFNWRSMRWAEHVARVGEGRCVYRFLVKKWLAVSGHGR